MEKNTEIIILNESDLDINIDIRKICWAMIQKGYDIENQMAGYILSKDPIYITNYLNARNVISKYNVEEILQYFINYYVEKEIVK